MEIKLNIGGSEMRSSIPPRGSIPPSVRGHRAGPTPAPKIEGKRGQRGKDMLIEEALAQGKQQEQTIISMINDLQKAGLTEGMMPEYDALVERLDKVQATIKQAFDRLFR